MNAVPTTDNAEHASVTSRSVSNCSSVNACTAGLVRASTVGTDESSPARTTHATADTQYVHRIGLDLGRATIRLPSHRGGHTGQQYTARVGGNNTQTGYGGAAERAPESAAAACAAAKVHAGRRGRWTQVTRDAAARAVYTLCSTLPPAELMTAIGCSNSPPQHRAGRKNARERGWN